jgi:hypothetical protein
MGSQNHNRGASASTFATTSCSRSSGAHFGCSLRDGAIARDLRERLRNRGVPELAWEDSADYVGVKVADPDGYVVELAYEP